MRVGLVAAAETRELRRRVLRPDFGPGDPLPADDISATVHVAAVDEDATVVGTCVLFPEDCPWRPDAPGAWRLRSMAVAPDRQGTGVGALVLSGAVDYLVGRDVPLLWCHARLTAAGFYARYGFVGHGEVFTDPAMNLPHLYMARELRSPPTTSR